MKRLRNTCLCCKHGYDERRGDKKRCCAIGQCCEIVGHADVQVTMAVYAHASLEDQRKALEQLDEMVAG